MSFKKSGSGLIPPLGLISIIGRLFREKGITLARIS